VVVIAMSLGAGLSGVVVCKVWSDVLILQFEEGVPVM